MGLISNIRKHLWFVTILIALALIGFIVMDMTTGKGAIFNNTDTLGKVAGEKINYKDFLQTEKVLYNNTDVDYFGRKEYLWNQYVERILLNKEADNNGTGVSEPELKCISFAHDYFTKNWNGSLKI
jgi:peptidyl-prolyl cis-trans isomerase D